MMTLDLFINLFNQFRKIQTWALRWEICKYEAKIWNPIELEIQISPLNLDCNHHNFRIHSRGQCERRKHHCVPISHFLHTWQNVCISDYATFPQKKHQSGPLLGLSGSHLTWSFDHAVTLNGVFFQFRSWRSSTTIKCPFN